MFTYENNIPVCYWMNIHECEKLPCIVDERICGDTFLRVERLNKYEFVVADIWMYNSNCVYACSNFEQRYNWLKIWLKTFFQSNEGFIKLIHKTSLTNQSIRGYEEHPYEIGKHGYFVEKDETFKIVKLSIPDCYEVVGKGYLRVPDLKTSVYLRSKGNEFHCKCVAYDEEYWDLVEKIPEIEVNAY